MIDRMIRPRIAAGSKHLLLLGPRQNVTESETGGLRSFEEVAHKPVKKFILFTGESPEAFSRGETAVPYQRFFQHILPSA